MLNVQVVVEQSAPAGASPGKVQLMKAEPELAPAVRVTRAPLLGLTSTEQVPTQLVGALAPLTVVVEAPGAGATLTVPRPLPAKVMVSVLAAMTYGPTNGPPPGAPTG